MDNYQSKANCVKTFIEYILPKSHIPGIAIAVTHKGKNVFLGGFGVKNIKSKEPITTKSLFEIGSCTKTFIAVGLAYFVSIGKITWDTQVVKVLPNFQAYNSYLTENLNIMDLLAHRTGFGADSGDTLIFTGGAATNIEIVNRVKFLPPKTSLRNSFGYNNIAYEIAGVILEKLAGTSWYNFVQKYIWNNLGMNSTYPSIRLVYDKTKMVNGHYDYYDNKLNNFIVSLNYSNPLTPKTTPAIQELAAGGVVTNIEDFSKWMIYLLDPAQLNVINSKEIINGQSPFMITTLEWNSYQLQTDIDPRGNSFGSGLGYDIVGRHPIIDEPFFSKGGDTFFCNTQTGFLPSKSLGVVCMCNAGSNLENDQFALGIRNALLQIYLDYPMENIMKQWQIIYSKILTTRSRIDVILPHNTLKVPLSNGKIINIDYRQTISLSSWDLLIKMCNVYGLPPLQSLNIYLGTYYFNFSGTAIVSLTKNGLLYLRFGSLHGTLSRLNNSSPESFIWPLAARTSFQFNLPMMPVIFSENGQSINIIGINFIKISHGVSNIY